MYGILPIIYQNMRVRGEKGRFYNLGQENSSLRHLLLNELLFSEMMFLLKS